MDSTRFDVTAPRGGVLLAAWLCAAEEASSLTDVARDQIGHCLWAGFPLPHDYDDEIARMCTVLTDLLAYIDGLGRSGPDPA
jgi:hypothetical protein